MNEEIKKLVDKTTIIQVINNTSHKIEYGNENITSRYYNHQKQQIDIDTLKEYWIKKWDSFGDKWTEERQLSRFLFDTFQIFYYSFKQLKHNKATTIRMDPYDPQLDVFIKFSNANLFGVYNYGKKCIDIINKLSLTDILSDIQIKFVKKFKETRNKIFEHNYNPSGFNMTIAPSTWSMASTNSICKIAIHSEKEAEYIAKIDYYDDYYNLESILVLIINNFSRVA